MIGFTRVPVCPTHKQPLELAHNSLACPKCATGGGKAERVWRQCGRKRGAYAGRGAAERAANDRGLRAYQCPVCSK